MSDNQKQFRFYLFLPEMRIFWVLFVLLVVVFVICVVNLSALLAAISAVLLLFICFYVLISMLWVGKVNYKTKMERSELKSIVGGLQDGLIAYDQNFRITFFNRAAESLFGLKTEEMIGHVLKPQDVENKSFQLLAQVIFPSLAPSLALRSKAGEYPQIADLSFADPACELRVATAPMADENGQILGFMKIIHDRTREVTLIKSKSEFIAVASHQLRTPITELNWAMETIVQDQGLDASNQDIAKNALSSARKMKNIVEDLLNASRIEEGRFGYKFQPMDIVEYVGQILSEVMPQVEKAGLKIYFDRPSDPLPAVSIDPQKISMVLSNLLDNAVRYNVQNGEITVSVKKMPQGPFLDISVKDTGIGVPQEQMDKLFSKFFRAENAVKFQADGSGLGLYIARNIVRAHGGQMWAESQPGRGSTFHLTLPTDPTLVPTQEMALE